MVAAKKKITTKAAETAPAPKQPQVETEQPQVSDEETEDDASLDEEEEQEPVSDEEEQDDDDDEEDDEAPASSADEQEEEEDDDEPASDDGEELEAVGFGDAMSKILQQNVAEDAQPILAKRTTARMREISNEKKEAKTVRMSAAEKRAKEQKDVVIPDHTTAVQDRKLRMIATKGVVALFNAIQKHQHQSGASATDEKNDKKVKELSKEGFLGLLKASQKDVNEKNPPAAAKPAAKSSWSVIQDDYMMGAKLKDWDAVHGTELGRARHVSDDEEAAEDTAWKQVGDLGSDDEKDTSSKKPARTSAKRKAAAASGKSGSKKSKRS